MAKLANKKLLPHEIVDDVPYARSSKYLENAWEVGLAEVDRQLNSSPIYDQFAVCHAEKPKDAVFTVNFLHNCGIEKPYQLTKTDLRNRAKRKTEILVFRTELLMVDIGNHSKTNCVELSTMPGTVYQTVEEWKQRKCLPDIYLEETSFKRAIRRIELFNSALLGLSKDILDIAQRLQDGILAGTIFPENAWLARPDKVKCVLWVTRALLIAESGVMCYTPSASFAD